MVLIKSAEEISLMREAGRLLANTFVEVKSCLAAGVAGKEVDRVAEAFIRSHGGEPAFKGYRGYPATICFSVNEGVVHGIPGEKTLQNGDIVSVDIGVKLNGYYADAARTYAIGTISTEAEKLIRVTNEALEKGIDQCAPGKRIGDVAHAIQKHVEQEGFSVVRDLVGHGIGKSMHEDPAVPNYGEPGKGTLLKEGMVLAIEPMVNMGSHYIDVLDDNWSVITADKSMSAHFENTVAVTFEGADVLTLIS